MTDKEALAQLRAEKCLCGRRKRIMNAVCGGCYWRLPLRLRKRLYRGFAEGFAKELQKVLEHLKLKEV
jgi:hypothetical protein